jgi:hypothetical protein
MYFEAGLNCSVWGDDLTRRISSDLSSASKTLSILPSWSWIGWEGRILGGWRSNEDYIKQGRYTVPLYTIPITEWYTSDDPLGDIKRRISSKFLRERDLYKDRLSRPLPRGWTHHPHDPDMSLKKGGLTSKDGKGYVYPPPDDCGTLFYTHDSAPDTEFWYLIPILDRDAEPIIPPQTQYIFYDTNRAYLYTTFNEPESRSYNRHVWLRDENGTWAGALILHVEADHELLKSDSGPRVRIELVAISRGYIASDRREHTPVEMGHEERPKDTKLYEFYNVLWIGWKDGIAYMKAHGRGLWGFWEKQNLEAVSLVLG